MNRYFHFFVADLLARRLPYRRKALVFGPRVCEFAAVLSMGKGAFFLAGSLGLANKSAAEEALVEAGGKNWKRVFDFEIELLKVACTRSTDPDITIYKVFFPEKPGICVDLPELLSPQECRRAIEERALLGLLCGVLFPEIMLSMLKAWVAQAGKTQDLGVGGLKVQEHPFLTSVEQAYEAACSVYEAWRQV